MQTQDYDFLQSLYDTANQYQEEANSPFVAPEDRAEARTALEELFETIEDVDVAIQAEQAVKPILCRPDWSNPTRIDSGDRTLGID